MRFTSQTSSDGVSEQLFTLGEISGVLWTPEGATGTRPLILMGHGGGQHKKAPDIVVRARRFVAKCGFAVAAVDQYTSQAFAEACRSAGVRQSMGAVGSSADNAAAESFNATFKRETLKGGKGWSNEREARLDAFRWLHRYNTRRRHSRLGQRSPIVFENTFQATATTLASAA